ncbi:MAG: hypothetical protein K0R46_1937 [Herbinix sp.]|jgi:ABC-type Fe3+ transport system permease subunit|nr:hypothetical protein [Herbinix sp.]
MNEDLIGIIVCGFIMLLLLALAVVLRSGRGAFLISGYNMLSKEQKAKYDEKALCRFVGNLLFVIMLFLGFAVIGGFYELNWLIFLSTTMIFAYTIGALIYANTNHRFKK